MRSAGILKALMITGVLIIHTEKLFSSGIGVSADYEYLKKSFIFEIFARDFRNARGQGSKLIFDSVHRLSSVGVSYDEGSLGLAVRYTPRTHSGEGRTEDIDYTCIVCEKSGPAADLKTFSIRDKMERNHIEFYDIWSHSFSDRNDIYYESSEASALWFPFSAGRSGLFIKADIKNYLMKYNINNYYNIYHRISYIPASTASVRLQNRAVSAAAGYRNQSPGSFYFSADAGVSRGEDRIDLEYRLRWVDVRYAGYGSGFLWSAEAGWESSGFLNIFLKAGQNHYFGSTDSIKGVMQGAVIQGYGYVPFVFLNGSYYKGSYAARTGSITAGLKLIF